MSSLIRAVIGKVCIMKLNTNAGPRTRASFILDPSCKRDPKNFLQTRSEPRADTDRFDLFIDNNATSLRLF